LNYTRQQNGNCTQPYPRLQRTPQSA